MIIQLLNQFNLSQLICRSSNLAIKMSKKNSLVEKNLCKGKMTFILKVRIVTYMMRN